MRKVKSKRLAGVSEAGARSRNPNPERRQAVGEGSLLPKTDAFAVADRLHSAAIHLLRRVRQQDVATREGPARLSALSVLVFGGPKTLKELAAAELVKPPTMSRIVAGLTRSGLVDIASDRDDARRLRIRATPKGTRLLQKARRRRVEDLASRLAKLPPVELTKLAGAVEILKEILSTWD
jgi:DNA-binding MarR family transcriptional regulator